jgi:hypothetical protein
MPLQWRKPHGRFIIRPMIRADLLPAASPPPPRVPAWALPDGPDSSDAEAAFFGGAALNALDTLVRSEPAWAGAWRQRLALKCAAAAVRLAGRSEDSLALRDAWYLRPAGGDPGPAGSILAAWRQLATRSPVIDAARLATIVELLGLRWTDDFLTIPDQIEHLAAKDKQPAPFAAAAIAGHVVAVRPDAELLAWWLTDFLLAQKLRWPKPVPLLMAQVFAPAFRATGPSAKRIRPGEEEIERAVCLALAQGAADACALAADLSRRAERLIAVTPKLRAKGAGEVIFLLLNEDAVSGSLVTKNLSRFGARRLFERLQSFEAVRELSGRSAFRLYGL